MIRYLGKTLTRKVEKNKQIEKKKATWRGQVLCRKKTININILTVIIETIVFIKERLDNMKRNIQRIP